MEELDAYLEKNPHLSANSKRAYIHGYKKIMSGLSRSLANSPQNVVIDVVEGLTRSPNTLNQLLNIAIQIKRFNRKAVELLLSRRVKNQTAINEYKDKRNKEKLGTLPKMYELKAHMNQMYSDGRWRDYIINYLLINFNTRNKDLDLSIVSSMPRASKKNENYLVLRKNDIVFIRRNYKTAKFHGEKSNIFKQAKMRSAIKNYIADVTGEEYKYPHYDPVYLLATGKNQRIKEDSIHNFVRKSTLHGLSEGDYNKIAVSEIKDIGDFRRLKDMSTNRGTSVDNLITEYNLNFKNVS